MSDFDKILAGHDLLGTSRRERIALTRGKYRRLRKIRDRLAATGLLAVAWSVSAWTLMITVGIAHRDWWRLMPAMGFRTALILILWPLAVSFAATLIREYLN